MKRTHILLFLFVLVFTLSCEEEIPLKNFHEREGVFILNEGNYTYGNSSLSFYNPETKQVLNQIFRNTNGFPVGDVLQSMTIMDSTAFLVVNNSGKILTMNTNTFKHQGTITGLVSPREMLILSPSKAYVSDLYAGSITIVNPSSRKTTGNITLRKGSESLLQYNHYVFAGNWSKQNTIQRIDVSQDALIDSLTVVRQPNSMVLDIQEKLWVLSDGGPAGYPGGKVRACLTKIDPSTFTIEKEYHFPDLNSAPSRLCLNSSKDTLYFLNGSWEGSVSNSGVYRMAVNAAGLPQEPWIPENGRLFYALGVDPKNGDVYVSDAIDYLQPGWVLRFNKQAVRMDSFKTDIIPSSFCFKYDKF